MQRFDKFGRKAASTDRVFTLRNNTRREARKICEEKKLRLDSGLPIPIISVKQEWGSDDNETKNGADHRTSDTTPVTTAPDHVFAAAAESAACAD